MKAVNFCTLFFYSITLVNFFIFYCRFLLITLDYSSYQIQIFIGLFSLTFRLLISLSYPISLISTCHRRLDNTHSRHPSLVSDFNGNISRVSLIKHNVGFGLRQIYFIKLKIPLTNYLIILSNNKC